MFVVPAACAQVYRGTWTNIDVAAKEYLAVDDCEVAAGKNPSELAMQRARVSVDYIMQAIARTGSRAAVP
jgi:hypothetical protein